jgi:hypothetical protein
MLKDIPASDLGATVAKKVLEDAKLDPGQVDQVIVGNVLQAGQGMNPGRQVALKAGLPTSVPGMTLNLSVRLYLCRQFYLASGSNAIGRNGRAVPVTAILDDTALCGIIDINDTEATRVAISPLKIVHERPDKVPCQGNTFLYGNKRLEQVVVQILGA